MSTGAEPAPRNTAAPAAASTPNPSAGAPRGQSSQPVPNPLPTQPAHTGFGLASADLDDSEDDDDEDAVHPGARQASTAAPAPPRSLDQPVPQQGSGANNGTAVRADAVPAARVTGSLMYDSDEEEEEVAFDLSVESPVRPHEQHAVTAPSSQASNVTVTAPSNQPSKGAIDARVHPSAIRGAEVGGGQAIVTASLDHSETWDSDEDVDVVPHAETPATHGGGSSGMGGPGTATQGRASFAAMPRATPAVRGALAYDSDEEVEEDLVDGASSVDDGDGMAPADVRGDSSVDDDDIGVPVPSAPQPTTGAKGMPISAE